MSKIEPSTSTVSPSTSSAAWGCLPNELKFNVLSYLDSPVDLSQASEIEGWYSATVDKKVMEPFGEAHQPVIKVVEACGLHPASGLMTGHFTYCGFESFSEIATKAVESKAEVDLPSLAFALSRIGLDVGEEKIAQFILAFVEALAERKDLTQNERQEQIDLTLEWLVPQVQVESSRYTMEPLAIALDYYKAPPEHRMYRYYYSGVPFDTRLAELRERFPSLLPVHNRPRREYIYGIWEAIKEDRTYQGSTAKSWSYDDTPKNAQDFARALQAAPKLISADFDSAQHPHTLMKSAATLPSLLSLALGDPDKIDFSELIAAGGFQKLKSIGLNLDHVDLVTATQLNHWLRQLPKLESLCISHRGFIEGPEILQATLQDLTGLKKLSMGSMFYSSERHQQLVDILNQLPHLQDLRLTLDSMFKSVFRNMADEPANLMIKAKRKLGLAKAAPNFPQSLKELTLVLQRPKFKSQWAKEVLERNCSFKTNVPLWCHS